MSKGVGEVCESRGSAFFDLRRQKLGVECKNKTYEDIVISCCIGNCLLN